MSRESLTTNGTQNAETKEPSEELEREKNDCDDEIDHFEEGSENTFWRRRYRGGDSCFVNVRCSTSMSFGMLDVRKRWWDAEMVEELLQQRSGVCEVKVRASRVVFDSFVSGTFSKHRRSLRVVWLSSLTGLSISVPRNSTASLKLHIMFVATSLIVFDLELFANVCKSFFPVVDLSFLLRPASTKIRKESCSADEKAVSGGQNTRAWLLRLLHDGRLSERRDRWMC